MLPDARLLYIVRDPIDRIAAHWVHNYSKGRHQGELARTILNPKTSYVARSLYAMQLERFLAVYPREQILVLEQEDLRLEREETLREVFEFAGADPAFTDRRFASERHKTQRKTRLTPLGSRIESRRADAGPDALSTRIWSVARGYWPMGRRIERPQIREAHSRRGRRAPARGRRAPARADRARLRALVDLGAVSEERHRGEGAVLGVRVLRYSGVQGIALAGASVLHLVIVFVVAHFLGPSQLGRFAILYFGANLLAQLLTILVKPGTIRRTFARERRG